MSEEFNPYVNPENNQAAQPTYAAPQSPWQQPPVSPQQMPPQQMPQPQGYVYPPQPTNAQRVNYRAYAEQKSSSGAAKAFGIVSFIIGCFVLMIASMIFFNFRTTVTQKYNYALSWGFITGLPAIIFGVVSIMKKTEKKIFPILGIAFGAILLLAAFITYFFMVNTAPEVSHVYY